MHGVSSTSLLGLALWIFGYLIDFSGNKSEAEKKKEDKTKKEEEEKKRAENEKAAATTSGELSNQNIFL